MAKKSRAGRPAMPDDEQQRLVPVRLPRELLARIDGEVASNLAGLRRSGVIRQLLVEALALRAKRKA